MSGVQLGCLDFSVKSKLALATINVRRDVAYTHLKPMQALCLKQALSGDTLAVLPTGFGKSLIFEMLPLMTPTRSTIIICTPLNSIIEEQLFRFGEQAVRVKEAAKNRQQFQQAKYTYAIGHPEDLVMQQKTFLNKFWQDKVSHIVVDEAHCIVQWGKDFRKDFLKLPTLLSWFPKAKVLALTATATVQTREEICKTMLMKDPQVISASIDRPNLKLAVHKRPPVTGGKSTAESSFASVMEPIIKELDREREDLKKPIIYANLNHCGRGYEQCVRKVPSSLVSQFHASCKEEVKRQIVQKMSSPNGPRLLFATEAYSMGTDAPDISRIVHIGPPTSLETYVQEIGRAGRDGRFCEAILHYNNTDIASNRPGMTTAVKDYCKSESCRRKLLCSFFGFDVENTGSGHLCCDNCTAACTCEECANRPIDIEDGNKVALSEPSACHHDEILKDLLGQYFGAESECSISFPEELLTDVVKWGKECTAIRIRAKYPDLDDVIVQNVLGIISRVQML